MASPKPSKISVDFLLPRKVAGLDFLASRKPDLVRFSALDESQHFLALLSKEARNNRAPGKKTKTRSHDAGPAVTDS